MSVQGLSGRQRVLSWQHRALSEKHGTLSGRRSALLGKRRDLLDRKMVFSVRTYGWLGPKKDISGQYRALKSHGALLSQTGHTKACQYKQGRRHEVLTGGGGRNLFRQTHLPPNSVFSSDFGHFILKILNNVKFLVSSLKISVKIAISGGTSPSDF